MNEIQSKALVELKDINISFDQKNILENINLTIKQGEITTIIGPNGSGKTTLAKLILGLFSPCSGTVTIDKSIKFGYMPQKLFLDRALPLTVHRFLNLQGKKFKQDDQFLNQISEEVGITNILPKRIQDLSPGQLQRVILARALINQPNVLILDEPVQGVDIMGQIEFYKLIDKIRAKRETAIVMISHDLYMVMRSTDHVICLNHHICCEGSPEDISKHPSYINLFGTEALGILAVYSHHHDHAHSINDN